MGTRRAYTIIEVVIVLMILAIALAVAAPRFARSMATSSDSPQQVINLARHTAIDRAQTMSLVIGQDGRWNLAETAISSRDLANGVTTPSPAIVQMSVSPAGICVPDENGQNAVIVDPVSCSILFGSTTSK